MNITLRWNPEGITIAGVTNISGTAVDQLNEPIDLALDYLNTMYVVDRANHRVQKFLNGFRTGSTVAGMSTGTANMNLSGLQWPAYVLLDPYHNMYIADSGNHRIQLWKNGASIGQTVAGKGKLQNLNRIEVVFY